MPSDMARLVIATVLPRATAVEIDDNEALPYALFSVPRPGFGAKELALPMSMLRPTTRLLQNGSSDTDSAFGLIQNAHYICDKVLADKDQAWLNGHMDSPPVLNHVVALRGSYTWYSAPCYPDILGIRLHAIVSVLVTMSAMPMDCLYLVLPSDDTSVCMYPIYGCDDCTVPTRHLPKDAGKRIVDALQHVICDKRMTSAMSRKARFMTMMSNAKDLMLDADRSLRVSDGPRSHQGTGSLRLGYIMRAAMRAALDGGASLQQSAESVPNELEGESCADIAEAIEFTRDSLYSWRADSKALQYALGGR